MIKFQTIFLTVTLTEPCVTGKWGMHMELGEESCGVKNKTWKDNITLDLTQKGCENWTWMETVQDYATSSAD